MKTLKLFLIVAIASIFLYSCGDTTAQNRVTVSQPKPQDINVQSNDIPGFNVNRFADLLKTTSSPDALTQAINANGNDINNLDLDEDGQIDYLKVDQVNNTNTLAVYDETSNDKVEICKLTVNTQNNSYSVVGSPQYCGNTHVYQSSPGLTFGQYMFLSWMLTPHPYYHPYWGYHRGYYGGYRPYYSHYSRPYTRTYSRTRTVSRSVPTSVRTSRSTPTQVRSSSSVRSTPQRTSVSNPVRSQREFSRGEGNRYRSSGATGSGFRSSSSSSSRGGFGSRSSSSSSSSYGSSRSSSRSSFGSSRSSFGSSRSSSRGGRR
jgi:hypothetical protein